jgi:PilZ domain
MALARHHQFNVTAGRQAERRLLDAQVEFRAKNRRAKVKVRDISTHGARISAIHLLRVGDRFFMKLPILEAIEAHVAWADEFELGCEFMRPLHPSVLDAILARMV